MRSSALHRGLGLTIAGVVGAALVAAASRAGIVWAVLAAVPAITMLLLEASSRRHPVAEVAFADEPDVLPTSIRVRHAARREQATAGLYDLAAHRARRARPTAELPEGHLAPVVQLPIGGDGDERLRAHG